MDTALLILTAMSEECINALCFVVAGGFWVGLLELGWFLRTPPTVWTAGSLSMVIGGLALLVFDACRCHAIDHARARVEGTA